LRTYVRVYATSRTMQTNCPEIPAGVSRPWLYRGSSERPTRNRSESVAARHVSTIIGSPGKKWLMGGSRRMAQRHLRAAHTPVGDRTRRQLRADRFAGDHPEARHVPTVYVGRP